MSERKIVSYDWAYADTVNARLAEGWQPFGPMLESRDNYLLYQAIVKYEEPAPPPDINARLITVLADALNILVAEADHHERTIEALEHAQRRGYVTFELRELEMQHEADREAVVMRARQEGWVK